MSHKIVFPLGNDQQTNKDGCLQQEAQGNREAHVCDYRKLSDRRWLNHPILNASFVYWFIRTKVWNG